MELLQQGKWANADVYTCERCNQRLVRKEFLRKSPVVRWFFGVLLTWREARALRRLVGVSGVPKLEACCSSCLCYDYLEGTPLGYVPGDKQLPRSFLFRPKSCWSKFIGVEWFIWICDVGIIGLCSQTVLRQSLIFRPRSTSGFCRDCSAKSFMRLIARGFINCGDENARSRWMLGVLQFLSRWIGFVGFGFLRGIRSASGGVGRKIGPLNECLSA